MSFPSNLHASCSIASATRQIETVYILYLATVRCRSAEQKNHFYNKGIHDMHYLWQDMQLALRVQFGRSTKHQPSCRHLNHTHFGVPMHAARCNVACPGTPASACAIGVVYFFFYKFREETIQVFNRVYDHCAGVLKKIHPEVSR